MLPLIFLFLKHVHLNSIQMLEMSCHGEPNEIQDYVSVKYDSTQLNSILFAYHITFENEYMKCAHKRQKIETAI